MLPITKPTAPQLYTTELESPPEINKLITTAYDTFVDPLLHQLIAAKTAGTYMLPTNLQSLGQIDMAALKVKENRLYYKGHLFIPNSENLQQQLIQMAHNLQSSGHLGKEGTYKLFSQYYFWPKIIDSVKYFISACYSCKHAKAFNTKYQRLLHPLPIPIQ